MLKSAARVAAGHTAAAAAAAGAAAVSAVTAAATSSAAPPPPPRETWTYPLLDACGCTDPEFCCFGCCCPCLATPQLRAYRMSGSPDAKASECAILCSLFTCWCCGDGLLGHERDRIRAKTNIISAECWNGQNAGSPECCACVGDCVATTCFCGCAAVQMKRELAVHFGHAGDHAVVHAGSPAAKKMSR